MGNNQICKECETTETNTNNHSQLNGSRQAVEVNVIRKKNEDKSPSIESLPDNKFRVKYASGEVYVGEMAGPVKQGRGRLEWPEGGYYEGNWDHDQAAGQGVFE